MPIDLTWIPMSVIPSMSARESLGPERRPSRPTHIVSTLFSLAKAPNACPIARAASSVNVLSTTPRMS